MAETIKQISLKKVFGGAGIYLQHNWFVMSVFALLNYLLTIIGFYGLGGREHPLFLPLMIVIYLFWGCFFRYYFQKRPYFLFKPFVRSLVPSIKVVFVTVVVVWGFLMLPYIPLLLGILSETQVMKFVDGYLFFLQKYMQDSHLLDIGLNLVLVLIMPQILYRPMLAWVAALMGRRGSLRIAWAKTKGNYRQFVAMALLMNIPVVMLSYMAELSPVFKGVSLFVLSGLLLYYNLVIAQVYDFFYRDD